MYSKHALDGCYATPINQTLFTMRITRISKICYHTEPRSGKGTTSTFTWRIIYWNSKSSPLASDLSEDTKSKRNWDESLATLSEAAVLSSPFLSLLNQ